ncbi:hypothetical protein EDD22DRAFT_1050513 [Suillus occidentalis]|nr:hypothetical protein EDD22DRAFT_1050513 [Suillus occidentalis]
MACKIAPSPPLPILVHPHTTPAALSHPLLQIYMPYSIASPTELQQRPTRSIFSRGPRVVEVAAVQDRKPLAVAPQQVRRTHATGTTAPGATPTPIPWWAHVVLFLCCASPPQATQTQQQQQSQVHGQVQTQESSSQPAAPSTSAPVTSTAPPNAATILVKADQRFAEFTSRRVNVMSPFNVDQRVGGSTTQKTKCFRQSRTAHEFGNAGVAQSKLSHIFAFSSFFFENPKFTDETTGGVVPELSDEPADMCAGADGYILARCNVMEPADYNSFPAHNQPHSPPAPEVRQLPSEKPLRTRGHTPPLLALCWLPMLYCPKFSYRTPQYLVRNHTNMIHDNGKW